MRISDADHWTNPSLQTLIPSGDGESGFLMRMGIEGDFIEVMSSDSWERFSRPTFPIRRSYAISHAQARAQSERSRYDRGPPPAHGAIGQAAQGDTP